MALYWAPSSVPPSPRGRVVTALVAATKAAADIHVLIIAVGHYDGTGLSPLPGAVLSAGRLADFWRDCTPARGHKLGSLDVLISSQKPVSLKAADGTTSVIEPASSTAVAAALDAWASRCATGALGVLHWIGHGETISQTDEAGAGRNPGQVLYTQDIGRVGTRPTQLGFDWDKTLNSLQRLVPVPVLCFIDACSNAPLSKDAKYPSAWRIDNGPILHLADVFHSSRPGAKAHCAREDQPVGQDFTGGALFSEAVRMALSRYGADSRDDRDGFVVFKDYLQRAAKKRLERWGRGSKRLKALETVFVSQGQFDLDEPIVALDAPYGMIDLVHPGVQTSGIDCVINDSAGLPHVSRPANELWEADLPYEDAYDAKLQRSPRFSRQVVPVGEKRFNVYSPHHIVEVH